MTDIEMPGLSGLELAQRIARHELPIKVVIVTTFARAGFLRRALEAGVLVTDIEMPGLSGLELAQRIARHELPIKVVIVTT
ncbi:hypothetical protein C7E12_21840, partial [Stenotrophomonas maltophilia]